MIREVVGDLWDYPASVYVIPTNGFVKKGNPRRAVMGAGLALQAATRYPNLPEVLGRCILGRGNHVYGIAHNIVAFPTKNDWRDDASLELIEQSARELKELADKIGWPIVAMPRVGCGLGGLRWGHVKPVLEAVFGDDNRFVVVDRA